MRKMHRQTDIHLLMLAAHQACLTKKGISNVPNHIQHMSCPLWGTYSSASCTFLLPAGPVTRTSTRTSCRALCFFCDIAPSLRQGALVLYRCVMTGKANPADTLAALPVLLAAAALAWLSVSPAPLWLNTSGFPKQLCERMWFHANIHAQYTFVFLFSCDQLVHIHDLLPHCRRA